MNLVFLLLVLLMFSTPQSAISKQGTEIKGFRLGVYLSSFPKTGTSYKVQAGDTLTKIAIQFGSRVDWIKEANQIKHPKDLKVGQILFIHQERKKKK